MLPTVSFYNHLSVTDNSILSRLFWSYLHDYFNIDNCINSVFKPVSADKYLYGLFEQYVNSWISLNKVFSYVLGITRLLGTVTMLPRKVLLGNVRNRSNKRCVHSYSLLDGIESNRQSDTQIVVRRSFINPSWSIQLHSTLLMVVSICSVSGCLWV